MLLETFNFPTIAPAGWETPDTGTTGAVLWEISNPLVSLRDLLSEANINYLYPWQEIQVLVRLSFQCHVYKPESIDTFLRHYLPHRNMGSWQLLSTGGTAVVEDSLNLSKIEGYINYDLQTITGEYRFMPYYITEGGGSPYEGRIDQCSLWLQPFDAGLPAPYEQVPSYYPADVDTVNDALLRTTGQIAPVPVEAFLDYNLSAGFKAVGFYLFRGAAIDNLSVSAEIISRRIALSADKQYLASTCKAPPGTSIDCAAEFADFIATHPDSYVSQGTCEMIYGAGQCAENTFTCSDGVTTTPYWRGIGG
jgi:hypothetical protein